MHPAFFYGSYMDVDILRRFGAAPGVAQRARLPGWRLTFTPHANMVPSDGAVVEGILMEMDGEGLDRLYGPDGFVTTYRPVEVTVQVEGGEMKAATYVEDAAEAPPDAEYLRSFLAVAEKVGLPAQYLQSVHSEAERLGA